MHNLKFVGTILGTESHLPFISFGNADQIVSTPEVDFGEDVSCAQVVEKVRNQWEGVPILVCDAIEATIVNCKVQRAILLLDE